MEAVSVYPSVHFDYLFGGPICLSHVCPLSVWPFVFSLYVCFYTFVCLSLCVIYGTLYLCILLFILCSSLHQYLFMYIISVSCPNLRHIVNFCSFYLSLFLLYVHLSLRSFQYILSVCLSGSISLNLPVSFDVYDADHPKVDRRQFRLDFRPFNNVNRRRRRRPHPRRSCRPILIDMTVAASLYRLWHVTRSRLFSASIFKINLLLTTSCFESKGPFCFVF